MSCRAGFYQSRDLLIPSFVSFEANSLSFNLIPIEAKAYLCFYTNKIEDIYLINQSLYVNIDNYVQCAQAREAYFGAGLKCFELKSFCCTSAIILHTWVYTACRKEGKYFQELIQTLANKALSTRIGIFLKTENFFSVFEKSASTRIIFKSYLLVHTYTQK